MNTQIGPFWVFALLSGKHFPKKFGFISFGLPSGKISKKKKKLANPENVVTEKWTNCPILALFGPFSGKQEFSKKFSSASYDPSPSSRMSKKLYVPILRKRL